MFRAICSVSHRQVVAWQGEAQGKWYGTRAEVGSGSPKEAIMLFEGLMICTHMSDACHGKLQVDMYLVSKEDPGGRESHYPRWQIRLFR